MSNKNINAVLDGAGIALISTGTALLTNGQLRAGTALFLLGFGVALFKYARRE